MKRDELIDWLLEGDVAIQYQTYRDLLHQEKIQLQKNIASQGWGVRFLKQRHKEGYWGKGFYQPKWISTHYTLLDLKNLAIFPENQTIRESLLLILKQNKGPDGGIYPIGKMQASDVCVNGMFLNYASYFGVAEEQLYSVVDFLLSEHMPDGGFNCYSNSERGAIHSSMHSTISVIEGILQYRNSGYRYRLNELLTAQTAAHEFLFAHRLFRSHRTGEIIDNKFLRLSYPSRWRFDILRALDYFQSAKLKYDPRMDDAIEILLKKRKTDGTWWLQAAHLGQVHFDMEQVGKPSRWNTLRALRVLNFYNQLESK